MTEPRPRPRSALASPAVAASLAFALLVLVAATALVAGIIPPLGPAPSATGTIAPTGVPSAAASATASIPSFIAPTPTPEPTPTSYQVRAGDTLTSIARAFSTTARSIAWWNATRYPTLDPRSPAYDPDHVGIGWTLTLIPGVVVDDAHPPVPTGAPAPSGTASMAPATPTPAPGAPAATVSAGPRGTGRVALTFDMGGRLDPAVAIVTWLVDHGVHATVFPTGKTGSTTTDGVAALKLVGAHPDLFDVGNHSWDHPDFTTLTAAQMAQQLTSTEAAIAPLVGQTTKPWFRPPYGAWNAAVASGVGAAGWRYLVLWDVDTIDWKPTTDGGPTTDDIVAKVLANAKGGSIVLMHLGGYNTLDALPRIVSGLAAKGLTPVTLGEMLGG